MADKKISDLTAASGGATSDLFEIENSGGNSRKVTGAQLAAMVRGTLYQGGPLTVPAAASLTWVNQGSSAAIDVGSGLLLTPALDGNVHIVKAAAPSAPFDVYLRAETLTATTTATTNSILSQVGIALRDGVNGDFLNCVISESRLASTNAGNQVYGAAIDYWTSATVFSGTSPISVNGTRPYLWVKVSVTSTTVTMYVSLTGLPNTWLQIGLPETITSHVGAITEYGISVRASANDVAMQALVSYFSTTPPA